MEEGLVSIYFKQLHENNNSGYVLAKFYCELFGLPFAASLIAQFSKLTKIYGKKTVFFSILDISNSSNLDHTNIYGLINHVCKKRFEVGINSSTNDLTSIVDSRLEKIKNLKHNTVVIRSPFDD